MQAQLRIKNPDDTVVALGLTMTVKEARKLKADLEQVTGKTDVTYSAIRHLRTVIEQSEKVFFSEDLTGETGG